MKNQNFQMLCHKYILIMRMSTTLISSSHVGFGSATNKILKAYNFCIWIPNILYYDTLNSILITKNI